MRKAAALVLVVAGGAMLSACGAGGSLFNRSRPDEFAVSRQAPLVVPPDFALVPPSPGAPRPQDQDASSQAMETLFGGSAPRSPTESDTISRAGTAAPGIRTSVGDPKTKTVAKGAATRAILAAPEGDGQEAQVAN